MTSAHGEAQGGDGAGGRQLRADARANRQRVLVAAAEVFAALGSGAPIDEVARVAGVGVGTVYRHFPTKEDLFEAVVLDHFASLVRRVEELTRSDDPGAAFMQFVDELADSVSSKRDLADALGRAGVDIKAKAGGTYEELRGLVKVLLERAQKVGAIRDDIGIDELIVLVQGTCSAADHADMDDAATKRMLQVIFAGLRPELRPVVS